MSHPPSPALEGAALFIQLETVLPHNAAIIEGEGPVSIVTPAEQWAYAAEFPFPAQSSDPANSALKITVELRLTEGAVGIGCLGEDGQYLCEAEVEGAGSPEKALVLHVASGRVCKSIMVRNISRSSMPSRVEIVRIGLTPVDETAIAGHDPEIFVDDSALQKFTAWSGVTPGGFWTDWLGVRTRADVWAFRPEFMEIYNKERFENPGVPTDREHVLDWIPLIDAVAAASETFVMVALGAGWGRWVSAGAFAARQSGREYRVFGVEAEPTHFAWMLRHFAENELDPERCTLIRAAAAERDGTCWFMVGNAAAWYGQSIVSDSQFDSGTTTSAALWSEIQVGEARFQKIPCIDLKTISRDLPIIDYMHMDIQGSEADVLTAHPDVLQNRVRMVNIGTHSAEIETQLRALFSALGWKSVYDITLKSAARIRLKTGEGKRVEFGDGVQVWTNPALDLHRSTEARFQ